MASPAMAIYQSFQSQVVAIIEDIQQLRHHDQGATRMRVWGNPAANANRILNEASSKRVPPATSSPFLRNASIENI